MTRNGEKCTIAVQDTGIGIAKEHHKNLFTKFFRVNDDFVRAAGGTGLGLSIVKSIVDKHGGNVKIKSDLGSGSEFLVTLPVNNRWNNNEN